MLWTETDREALFEVKEGQAEFQLDFNPYYGTLLVFYNGLIVSREDYEVEGRTLRLRFVPEAGSYVLCRMVV